MIIAAFSGGKELTPLRILLISAIAIWGVRLTVNWAYTFGDLTHQDWRYTMLREKTGAFIRSGLWKYSRHPNYLGEILMWWGVAFSVIAAFPSAWYLAIGAVSNTVLFLVVSIPMADGRQSQKPEFEEYKSETRMLLPIKKH